MHGHFDNQRSQCYKYYFIFSQMAASFLEHLESAKKKRRLCDDLKVRSMLSSSYICLRMSLMSYYARFSLLHVFISAGTHLKTKVCVYLPNMYPKSAVLNRDGYKHEG